MTPKDLLGVFVRLAGLGLLLFSIFDLYYVVVKLLGLPTSSPYPISRDIEGAVFYLVLGFFALIGAKKIVQLAYWQKD